MSTISASKINTYHSCPRKYYLQYILNLKEPIESPWLEFGSRVHSKLSNNIFESEDRIVVKNDCLIDFADLTLNLKVLTVLMITDEGFICSIEAAGLFKSSLVRHATPEEIKAGKRL